MWDRSKLAALAVAICMLAATPGRADTLALDMKAGADSTESGDASRIAGENLGWTFDVLSPVTVTALGMWDEDSDGLATDHTVTLWDSAGTALASATLNNTATPLASNNPAGRWLFTSSLLTSGAGALNLAAGSYTISVLYLFPAGNGDHQRYLATAETPSAIDFGKGVFNLGTTSTRPTAAIGTVDDGFFGPNFQFVTASAAVPETATWLTMILAFAGFGFARRRAFVSQS